MWHGTPAERAEEAFAEERARPAERRWEGLEGGEPVRDFVTRIRLGAQLFLAERGIEPAHETLPVWRVSNPNCVLLVAHAGTNTVTICHLLGLVPVPWEWDRFILGHASLTRAVSIPTGEGWCFGLTPLRRRAPAGGPADRVSRSSRARRDAHGRMTGRVAEWGARWPPVRPSFREGARTTEEG